MGRGKHQSSLDLVAASKRILAEIQPATVRAVCYQLFVAKIIPDMSKNSTDRVSRQLTWAREEGHISWDWIVDETREAETISMWSDPSSFIGAVRGVYRRDLWREQKVDVEIWSEKGTIRGTLAPVLREYGVTLRVLHGFSSSTAIHEAAEASQSRPFVVLYVGDRDPSGMHMSDVDVPGRLERYGADVAIRRIALLDRDTRDLPSFPATDKWKDSRYAWYCAKFGGVCWELDAMRPPDLRARVEIEIRRFIDWPTWERSLKAEKAEVASIDTVLANWQKAISRPVGK